MPPIPEPTAAEVLDLGNRQGAAAAAVEAKPGEGAAPATDKKPDPKAKDLTEGEKDALQKFSNAFLGKDDVAVSPPPAKKTKEPAKAKEPEKPAPAKPKAVAKPKVAPKPAAQPLTADQIAEATARGVTAAMTPKPEDKKPAAPAESDLPAEEQEKISVLAQMEKQFGDKYRGLADKYKTSYRKLTAYAKDWESKHPGETFDDNAEEHKTFFEENDVDWEDQDYIKAMVKLSTDTALEAERRKTNEKLTKFERKEKLQEAAPQIFAEQVRADRNYWTKLGPEFADIVDEKGVINQAKLEEMKKADPVAYQIQVGNAADLRRETAAIYSLMNGLVEFDAKNEIHVAMGQFASEAEQRMVKMPAEDQLDAEGRSFMPAADFYKMKKAERESLYWTFNSTDIAALRAAALARETQVRLDSEEKTFQARAAARGLLPAKKGEERPQPKPAEKEEEPPPNPNEKPASPSAASESRAAALAGKKAGMDIVSSFAERQLGRG